MSVFFSHDLHSYIPPEYPHRQTSLMPESSDSERASLLKHNPPRLCPNPLLIPRVQLLDNGEVFGTRSPIRCNSWSCPSCRIIRLKYLYAMISKHCPKGEFHFLTLTLRRKTEVSCEDWFRLTHCWELFLKRIKRMKSGIKFFRCVELTKKGMPHLHVLINFSLSTHRTHDIWHEITGDSFKARFEPIRENVPAYILKYLDKGIESVKRIRDLTGKKTRIFQTSRGLFYIRPKVKKFDIIDFAPTEYHAAKILQAEYDRSPPKWWMVDFPELEFRGGRLFSFRYKLRDDYKPVKKKQDIIFSVKPPKVRSPVQYEFMYRYLF